MNKNTRNIIIIIIGLVLVALGYKYLYKGVFLDRESGNVSVNYVGKGGEKVEELLNNIVKSIEDDDIDKYREYLNGYYKRLESSGEVFVNKSAEVVALERIKSSYGRYFNISLKVDRIENTLEEKKKVVSVLCNKIFKINFSDVEEFYELEVTAKLQGGWPWQSKEEDLFSIMILKVKGEYIIENNIFMNVYMRTFEDKKTEL